MAANRSRRQRRASPAPGRTLDEWLPHWVNELGARGVSPATVRNQTRTLKLLADYVGHEVDARKVTDVELIAWRDSLVERGLKGSSVNVYLLAVGTFYNWIVSEGALDESPMFYVPLVRYQEDAAPPVLTDDQLKRMTKGATSAAKGRSFFEQIRDPTVIALLHDTGLRASECAGLLLEHLNLDGRQLYVHPEVAKGSRPRTVTFGFQTSRLISRYLRAREDHRYRFLPELFLGRNGPASYTVVRDLVRKAGAVAGVNGMRPHLLRHTWAHDMKSAGVELETLMSLGGWTTTAMPQRYGRAQKTERAVSEYQKLGSPVDRASSKRKGTR